MDDIEKTRAEYVVRLEEQIGHLTRQLAEVKPLADKWTPQVASEIDSKDTRITLHFGGKRITATFPTQALLNGDPTGLASSVVDTLCESLVVEKLREVVKPEVEKLARTAPAIVGAG